jgi:hypothetical protein
MAETAVHRAPTLDRWCQLSWTEGLQVEALLPLETIAVRTRNTRYVMTVTNPASGEVLVQGGRFFPRPTRAYVTGSSLGGGCLKVRGVYVGFLLEFRHDDQSIITTRIQEVERTAAGVVH